MSYLGKKSVGMSSDTRHALRSRTIVPVDFKFYCTAFVNVADVNLHHGGLDSVVGTKRTVVTVGNRSRKNTCTISTLTTLRVSAG